MSDYRELLELAAKAAGYDIDFEEGLCGWYPHGYDDEGDVDKWWNSLRDDGDAFRLAGALGMSIELRDDCCEASTENFGSNEHYRNHGGDKMAAARMAVLIAAAELGKRMRSEEALQEMADEGQKMGLYDEPEEK